MMAFVAIGFIGCNQENKKQPNIIIFYVDDLGYGDVGCNGAQGVKTPNIDRLAASGVQFTDAHCSASTCTPSRFSLLTGLHAFRRNAAILDGDEGLIIKPGSPTLPAMLQKAGYKTGIVGKWHLGLGEQGKPVNWNDVVKPGPLEVGFDYSFIIPATGDRVPCVFLEGHRVVNLDPNDPMAIDYDSPIGTLPTGTDHPELLKMPADKQHSNTIINGVSRIGYMSGGEKAQWVDERFPLVLNAKAETFIENNKEHPFFLFYSFHDIHVPRVPNQDFVGKSSMGPRGDAIAQMDWCVGKVMEMLKKRGLSDNTLVIFSSDNGPVLDDGYSDMAVEKLGEHKPWGPFRGGKYSLYEAGTRMPTIVNWPGKVIPGKNNALMSQIDLYASLAELVGYPISKNEAMDSRNYLDAWLGKSNIGREELLIEGFGLGIRKGDWKYIAPNNYDPSYDWIAEDKGIESGRQTKDQLFNLSDDIGERNNIAPEKQGLCLQLRQRLDSLSTNMADYKRTN